jgi:hypothetical protein
MVAAVAAIVASSVLWYRRTRRFFDVVHAKAAHDVPFTAGRRSTLLKTHVPSYIQPTDEVVYVERKQVDEPEHELHGRKLKRRRIRELSL